MSSDRETLLRQWQMLRMIPRYPSKITAKLLQEKLESENYSVAKRTVERDLQSLSESFPILSDERDKPYGWSWSKDAKVLDVPGMSNSEALTFKLVEQHLKPLLPASTLDQLAPYFKTAAQHLSALSGKSTVNSWLNKARVVQPNQALLPPKVNSDAQQIIYEALLQNRQIDIKYLKRGEKSPIHYLVHPLGIVQRGQITYLVCTRFESPDIRTLAMHRMKSAELRDEQAKRPKGFDLDVHIASGAFGFGGEQTVTLEAVFTKQAGDHLYETPLSADQNITALDDGRLRVTAKVVNTEQLRWWLLGFGERVEVVAPSELRKSIAQTAKDLFNIYHRK
jgi:predicted DNA-binding transcriptional regulator YafY